jgi:hypothetical protein
MKDRKEINVDDMSEYEKNCGDFGWNFEVIKFWKLALQLIFDILILKFKNFAQDFPQGHSTDIISLIFSHFPEKPNFQYPSLVPLESETHGGEDVPIYSRGPYAHLFTGTMEQNVIPHLISYATCIGNGLTACSQHKSKVISVIWLKPQKWIGIDYWWGDWN